MPFPTDILTFGDGTNEVRAYICAHVCVCVCVCPVCVCVCVCVRASALVLVKQQYRGVALYTALYGS